MVHCILLRTVIVVAICGGIESEKKYDRDKPEQRVCGGG